jgi:hypothetical protein
MISNAHTVARNFISTAISEESIAAMRAILQTVSKEIPPIAGEMSALADKRGPPPARRVTVVSKDEFRNEKLYQTTMHIVRKMLEDGIISEEEYRQIDTIFLEKYQPVFGTLFSDISLTYEP